MGGQRHDLQARAWEGNANFHTLLLPFLFDSRNILVLPLDITPGFSFLHLSLRNPLLFASVASYVIKRNNAFFSTGIHHLCFLIKIATLTILYFHSYITEIQTHLSSEPWHCEKMILHRNKIQNFFIEW